MAVNYNSKIVTDGLVLCLDAANVKSYPGSGTTWTDLSGNGNNGTLINGPTYDSGNGGSLVFDGTDDSADFGNILQLGTESRTYCCWYKLNTISTASTKYLITKTDNSSTSYRQALGFQSDGNFRIIFRAASNANYDLDLNNPNADNNWHHLVWIIDRTSNHSLYQDISFIGSKDISAIVNVNFQLNRPFRVGSYNNTSNAPISILDGNISHVSVYNRVLSIQEIQQNFNATRGRYEI